MPELYTYSADRVAEDVKDMFGDSGGVQLTDDMLLRWINDGQRYLARESDFLEDVASAPLLAGQALYDLSELIVGSRVKMIQSFVAGGSRLKQIGFSEYLQQLGTGVAELGTPTAAMVRGNSVTLWPTPDTTLADGLVVYFSQWPLDLDDLDDPLAVPDRFFDVLRDYVLAQAMKMNDDLSSSGQVMQSVTAGITNQYEREHASADDIYLVVPTTVD